MEFKKQLTIGAPTDADEKGLRKLASQLKNKKIGIGVIAYDSHEAKKIIGKNSKDIKHILGYEGRDELIHKDDLVKIN